MDKNKAMYGTKELDSDEFDPKHEKVRISIIMEGDLLNALKERATRTGRPYQTIMKEIIRKELFHSKRLSFYGTVKTAAREDREELFREFSEYMERHTKRPQSDSKRASQKPKRKRAG
jgi:hypothetical protein